MEKTSLLIVTVLIASSLLLFKLQSDVQFSPERAEFQKWMVHHDKSYESAEEKEFRFQVYKKNKEIVSEHNKKYQKGQQNYEMGINQFSDLMEDEFGQILSMKIQSEVEEVSDGKCTGPKLPYKDKFDETFTWVGKKTFSEEVGTQGKCQSGYAFAATQATEATMYRSFKSFTPLSVQQVIDCSKEQGNKGCDGGSPANAFQYLMTQGFMKGSQYPYTGVAGDCKFESSKKIWEIQNCTTIQNANISTIKSSILQKPVIVSFDATCKGFLNYKKGIYSGDKSCGNTINHYMLAVGWGAEKKGVTSISKTPYLLLKNSFGNAWGESGYVKVQIDSSTTGIAGMYKELHYPIG